MVHVWKKNEYASLSLFLVQPSYATENLYEAMYLYGMWINYTIESGVNRKNGAAWLDFTKNKSFEGNSIAETAVQCSTLRKLI